MSNTAQNLAIETIVLIPVEQLHKSPSQPRRRNDAPPKEDFVASIRQKGVLSPILVRKRKAGGWEIIYGHRRHTGSVLAGLDAIPAIVRDMTDEDVFEAQMIENIQREDMHPLDEADGFKRMMEKNGRTAQQIAEKIGRSVAYVAQRLKLVDLGQAARAALDKDKISLGIAMMVARIPASLQADAMKILWEGIEYREAKRQLEGQFLLRLAHAPFKLDDATLVEKAGACTECPKRTGQQRELFPDAGKEDMCVDPVCYRGKVDAVWKIRKTEAAAGGAAVLEGNAAEKAMSYSGGYKKLDDDEWTGNGHRKVRSLFGKDLPPVTLARDEKTGTIHELVRKADVDKAMRRAKPRSSSADPGAAARRNEEEKGKRREAAAEIAIAEAVAKKPPATGDLIRFMTAALADTTYMDDKILARRGSKVKTLAVFMKALKPAQFAGLGFELALRSFAPGRWEKPGPEWHAALKACGVNFDAIEKRLAAEAKSRKAAKKKPARKAA